MSNELHECRRKRVDTLYAYVDDGKWLPKSSAGEIELVSMRRNSHEPMCSPNRVRKRWNDEIFFFSPPINVCIAWWKIVHERFPQTISAELYCFIFYSNKRWIMKSERSWLINHRILCLEKSEVIFPRWKQRRLQEAANNRVCQLSTRITDRPWATKSAILLASYQWKQWSVIIATQRFQLAGGQRVVLQHKASILCNGFLEHTWLLSGE